MGYFRRSGQVTVFETVDAGTTEREHDGFRVVQDIRVIDSQLERFGFADLCIEPPGSGQFNNVLLQRAAFPRQWVLQNDPHAAEKNHF
jgi:hypothetical protein